MLQKHVARSLMQKCCKCCNVWNPSAGCSTRQRFPQRFLLWRPLFALNSQGARQMGCSNTPHSCLPCLQLANCVCIPNQDQNVCLQMYRKLQHFKGNHEILYNFVFTLACFGIKRARKSFGVSTAMSTARSTAKA